MKNSLKNYGDKNHDPDDGVTYEHRAVCNSWTVSADFHEFAFGLVYKEGYFYATLSMAMRLMSDERQKADRGRTIRISKDGSYEWINYGLRTLVGTLKGKLAIKLLKAIQL